MKIRNDDEDQFASLSSVTNAVIKRAMKNSDDEKALENGQFQRRVDETTDKSVANPTKVPTAGWCEQDEAHVQDARATERHSECDASSHEACEITDR
mgnify:CR=1 FL=1